MFFKDTFFYKRINRQKRCNKADTIYKIHKSNIAIKIKQQKQKKRSPSGRFLCCAGLFQSVVPPSVPQTTCHQKKEQLRKKSSSFFVVCVPSLHTVASVVRRGYYIHNTALLRYAPLHFIQQYLRLSPLMFWRLLYRQPSTSIGTPEKGLKLIICSAEASLFSVAVTRSYPYAPEKGLSV